ncbi:MAG: T9SS type A sorting domain-containing protein [Bacteroidales bacterium]|nr:T9SS type A sorting domain-containing protein [Bacteroidales bacterium]
MKNFILYTVFLLICFPAISQNPQQTQRQTEPLEGSEKVKFWRKMVDLHSCFKSAYSLSRTYRLGLGVEQNFETAFRYLKKAAESGHPQTLYGVGFFYYRGLGVEQSYSKAIEYFRAATSQQHGMSAFMLGLIYRNGFGVERDIAQGNLWLEKAKELGNRQAAIELLTDLPERPLYFVENRRIPTVLRERKPEAHEKITHFFESHTNIEGRYTGILITYDWSGRYPLKESFLDVTFQQNGSNVLVRWLQEGATEVVATATLTDYGLIFNEGAYYKYDHFRRQRARRWNFVKATLSQINQEEAMFLHGNLHLHTPETGKPGRPMSFVLQSKQPQNHFAERLILDTEPKPVLSTDLVLVYPNPFTDYLNMSFTLERGSNCVIEIYSMIGRLLHRKMLGQLSLGVHHYQINTSWYTSGSYVLRLICGDCVYSRIVIKER